MNRRIWIVSLLVVVVTSLPGLVWGATKLPKPISNQLTDFILFNFDNLIADHYEGTDLYQKQLLTLLIEGMDRPAKNIESLINNPLLNQESFPVKYMMKLNQNLKKEFGVYFVPE